MDDQPLRLPRVGDHVGSGIVMNVINAGGSARVYKTWVAALEIHRAVKVMNMDADPITRDRFQTEAKITSKLIHTNIVQIHNYGETDGGLPYIEMELITGQPLQTVIAQRGALPLSAALAVTVGILDGVNYAHNTKYTINDTPHVGVMHRDIKPGNVIFSGNTPKLIDFGIARPVAVSYHTIPGYPPGTIPYMAPETLTHGDCDFRTDIYQIGLLLYECINGIPAYPQTEMAPLTEAIKAGGRKPLKTQNTTAAAIVKRCLEPDPEKRYQTAQACLADVRTLFHTLNPRSTPETIIAAYFDGATELDQTQTTTSRWKAIPPALKYTVFCAACVFGTLCLATVISTYNHSITRPAAPAPASEPADTPATPATETPEFAKTAKQTTIPRPTPATPATKTATPTTTPAQPTSAVKPIDHATAQTPPPKTPPAQPTPPAKALPTTPPATEPPKPEDATDHIAAGNKLLSENKPEEALVKYQTALKTPSATPRQTIIKQSVYGVAKSNTALYKQGKIPKNNVDASWRSVQNSFPAGSPEHAEAIKQLSQETP